MTVDYSIACESAHGKSARGLAGTIVAIFPAGVPLSLFVLLFKFRREIRQRQTRSGDAALSPVAFLFRLYKPRYWYLPIIDLWRRLALSSVLLAITDPTVQLLVALAVSVSFVVAFREMKPFYEHETDMLYYVCGTRGCTPAVRFRFRHRHRHVTHHATPHAKAHD